jgi:hypothetical protein
MILLVACGATRSQADQDRDGRRLADAMRTAYTDGGTFKLDNRLLITGGDIPSGQALQLHATASSGIIKGDAARFAYRIQQGQQANDYEMMVLDGRLYVKQRSASAWKATPVGATTTLFPALRLELLREAVLLAASVSPAGITHVDAGFVRKYMVRPAPDQIEQLLSLPLQGAAETQFLKTASAEIDLYLLIPDDRLGRVEVRLSGTDPSNGEKQSIQSTLDVRSGRVATIQAPADAMLVAPSDLLA